MTNLEQDTRVEPKPPLSRAEVRPVSGWAAVGASAGSGALVACYALFPDHRVLALAFTVIVAVAGLAIARVDARSFLLPNRMVVPLAAFGLVQAAGVAIVTGDLPRLLISLASAAILGIVYLGLGLAGWFGLGDSKFAAALALSVAVYAGWLTLYILPIALVLGAVQRLISQLRHYDRSGGRAHGPAIAIAGIVILLAAVLVRT